MTDPATQLANALPADPDDHGPIAVPSDAVRAVLGELVLLHKRRQFPSAAEFVRYSEPDPDGGA